MGDTPHVVVLGAGFGGIGAVQRLRDANVRITIVDQRDYHTFQPLLYQVATDELAPTEVGFPVRELLHRHKNVDFHMAPVTAIDLAARTVSLEGAAPLTYDYLVLALGSVVNFHGTPGAAEHAFPLYTMPDAVRLKEHILRMFEEVDKNPPLVADGALTFSIVGGGATGTELAGALAELLHAELAKDYPNLPIDKARILLFQHSSSLLPSFKAKLGDYARRTLEERGVDVRLNIGVSRVGPAEIELSSGESIPTRTLIWAAGLRANPITTTLGIELAPGGRVPVGPELRIAAHPEVFAVGDIAAATDTRTGAPLPGLGAVALQAGRYAGEAIRGLLAGKTPAPFHYVDKGTMAQVGRGAALVELPFGGTLTGRTAWLAWLGVHLALLNGAEEKTSVFADWGWNILTHNRGKRIILSDEDAAAESAT